MLKKYNQKFLLAALVGFLMFYSLFWIFVTFAIIASGPRNIYNVPLSITLTTIEGLCQFPLAFLVGFPLFLLGLTICNRLTPRVYPSVVFHALLAVPLSGLVLASAEHGGRGIVQDWHEIVRLAAKWFEASLPSGAMGGYTSWALRPPRSRKKI